MITIDDIFSFVIAIEIMNDDNFESRTVVSANKDLIGLNRNKQFELN